MTTTVRFPLARVAAGAALIFATAIAIVAPVVEAMPARAADSYLVKGPGFTPAVPVDGGLSPRNAVPANENYQIVLVGLARDTLGDRLFVLGGRVIAGPTCPVERVPPEPGCADRPVHGLRQQKPFAVSVLQPMRAQAR